MRVNQLQPLLDAVEPRFDAVDSPIDAGHAFIDGGEAHLSVVTIVNETVQLLVNASQMTQKKAFMFVNHGRLYFQNRSRGKK
ncbi:MAG: hypothetical protein JO172_13775 [Hyphomicrobiales bacterium]|nr:hypothetical protein [Hyphomicrobiales bacterium]